MDVHLLTDSAFRRFVTATGYRPEPEDRGAHCMVTLEVANDLERETAGLSESRREELLSQERTFVPLTSSWVRR
jgi:hypothetical protein